MSDAHAKPLPEDAADLAPEDTAQPEAQPDPLAEAAKKIAGLEKQVSDLKDQLLRTLAEMENVRRRADKERKDGEKYAVSEFAKKMLDVADNFSRALEAAPKESVDPAVKNLLIGIDAVSRQLQSALESSGIVRIDPLGKPFDPNFHQAMMEVDNPDYHPGTVVQVLQAGYMIHDRLLREALVAVAKGGPTPPSGKININA